ncbi:DUF1127 domain-containing protein [Magnetovibrio blakemorei]|uniref:YjiS-like domain-containing protein n=1 Tax=Magnetovibrio blakemorei TaxID=28181 RepID=A0A1E5Q746_9PROT|nr:DUF1127 domain-containing protein [Magnetovibrio blakemorei]OEJ66908.1 hypothetical protein BEN30_10950 [Magnetovibrio blakemorei]
MNYNTITCCDDMCDVSAKTMTQQLFGTRVAALVDWVKRAYDVYRQRRHLAHLSARELSDLGITRAQAQFESARPFWDLPNDAA